MQQTSTSDQESAALADQIANKMNFNNKIEQNNIRIRKHAPGVDYSTAALVVDCIAVPEDFCRFEWWPASGKLEMVIPRTHKAGHQDPTIRFEVERPNWVSDFK